MRVPTLLICALLAGSAFLAQTDEKAVLAAVQRLFDAMAARDAAAGRAVIVPEGRYFALGAEAGLGGATLGEFVDRLPSRKEQMLERMFQPQVRLRGPVAQVWTDYDFHRDGRFSHCGVDAFTLVKTPDGWKIAALAYTVEKTGCPQR